MSSTSLTPPDDLLPLIETAAELRAVGNSWANIAKKLDRCERTVRRWKTIYRRHWQRLFREAEDDIFRQVACMATTTMANLVVNYDDPNQSRNCQFMIGKRREAILANQRLRHDRPKPAVSEYWAEVIAEMESESDEQMTAEILSYADELRERARQKEAEEAPRLLQEAVQSAESVTEGDDKDRRTSQEANAESKLTPRG